MSTSPRERQTVSTATLPFRWLRPPIPVSPPRRLGANESNSHGSPSSQSRTAKVTRGHLGWQSSSVIPSSAPDRTDALRFVDTCEWAGLIGAFVTFESALSAGTTIELEVR